MEASNYRVDVVVRMFKKNMQAKKSDRRFLGGLFALLDNDDDVVSSAVLFVDMW